MHQLSTQLSLLLSDALVALGGILNLKWISEERVFCGSFCSGQGGLEHISTPAVALSNLVSLGIRHAAMHITEFMIILGYCYPYVLYYLRSLEATSDTDHRNDRSYG